MELLSLQIEHVAFVFADRISALMFDKISCSRLEYPCIGVQENTNKMLNTFQVGKFIDIWILD